MLPLIESLLYNHLFSQSLYSKSLMWIAKKKQLVVVMQCSDFLSWKCIRLSFPCQWPMPHRMIYFIYNSRWRWGHPLKYMKKGENFCSLVHNSVSWYSGDMQKFKIIRCMLVHCENLQLYLLPYSKIFQIQMLQKKIAPATKKTFSVNFVTFWKL